MVRASYFRTSRRLDIHGFFPLPRRPAEVALEPRAPCDVYGPPLSCVAGARMHISIAFGGDAKESWMIAIGGGVPVPGCSEADWPKSQPNADIDSRLKICTFFEVVPIT